MASATASVPAMPVWRSLRLKFAFSFAVAGLVLVLTYALAIHAINGYQESQLIDQIVSDEIEDLVLQYERRGVGDALPYRELRSDAVRPGTNALALRKWFRASWLVQTYISRSDYERSQLPAALRELGPGFHDVTEGEARYRVEVRELGSTRFHVAYALTLHEERLRKFTWALAFSVALTAVATVLVGFWLSRRLTRQLVDLAARVSVLDNSAREAPLKEHYQEREVADLAAALSGYHERAARLLARERNFTADVSHELRTPLTAIQTGAELLLDEPDLPGKAREQAERIARGAARLSELVNVFLLLAREQDGGERDAIDLRECTEAALDPVRERAQQKGLRLEIEVPSGLIISAPRNALLVVLANLLGNAVRYTERGGIRITGDASGLQITDTGQGIDPARVPELFKRFRRGDTRGSEGFGLGLAIVKRICEQVGWKIRFDPRPEGGTRAVLLLASFDEKFTSA